MLPVHFSDGRISVGACSDVCQPEPAWDTGVAWSVTWNIGVEWSMRWNIGIEWSVTWDIGVGWSVACGQQKTMVY